MSRLSRPRTVSWLASLALALLASLQGCDCGSTGVDTRRFACTQDDECASGFLCRAGECRPEGEPVDGTDGGTDGGTDSGTPDGGGTDGGSDGGTPDGGTNTTPTQLTFITPPRSVEAGECSAAVTLELQASDGSAAPAGTSTTITLVAQSNSSVRFYSSATCGGSRISFRTIPAGRSRTTFYFKGTEAQPVRIVAVANGFFPAFQDELIQPAPPASVAFVTSSQTLAAGACSARVELEARDTYGNASPFAVQTKVALAAGDGAGFTFFTDSECTSPTTEALFAPGEARTSFSFKGRTGGMFNLFATTPDFPPASQSETILPAVRAGGCTLPLGAGSVTCPISPPQLDLSKTMLLFQASSDDDSPDSASLRCALTARSSFTCTRNDADDSNEPEMTILWQTLELASGLKVQHVQGSCGNAPITEIPIQPVSSLQNTFLLVSSEQDGSTQGDDDFYAASITSVDHVDLEFTTDCQSSWSAAIQVVELEGIHVTRGVTGAMPDAQLVVSNLPAVDPASTVLLFTYRTSGTTSPVICDRVLAGGFDSPTSITFSRGAGALGCTGASVDSISWERIEFGARAKAQHVPVIMPPGTASLLFEIGAVDPTRTLVFASGQAQSGQAMGETSYEEDDVIGAALGWHELASPTTLEVNRGAPLGTAKWFSTVLQLEP